MAEGAQTNRAMSKLASSAGGGGGTPVEFEGIETNGFLLLLRTSFESTRQDILNRGRELAASASSLMSSGLYEHVLVIRWPSIDEGRSFASQSPGQLFVTRWPGNDYTRTLAAQAAAPSISLRRSGAEEAERSANLAGAKSHVNAPLQWGWDGEFSRTASGSADIQLSPASDVLANPGKTVAFVPERTSGLGLHASRMTPGESGGNVAFSLDAGDITAVPETPLFGLWCAAGLGVVIAGRELSKKPRHIRRLILRCLYRFISLN